MAFQPFRLQILVVSHIVRARPAGRAPTAPHIKPLSAVRGFGGLRPSRNLLKKKGVRGFTASGGSPSRGRAREILLFYFWRSLLAPVWRKISEY